jgi:hypothetical protein
LFLHLYYYSIFQCFSIKSFQEGWALNVVALLPFPSSSCAEEIICELEEGRGWKVYDFRKNRESLYFGSISILLAPKPAIDAM